MMKLIFGIVLTLTFSTASFAKKNSRAKKSNIVPSAQNLKLETDVDFRGGKFLGQYANSSEVNAAVEGEKKLINVVEPRHNFKFQLEKSKEWN